MTEYLTPDQIKTLEDFVLEVGYREAVRGYIERHTEPEYEKGVVYDVAFTTTEDYKDSFPCHLYLVWDGKDFLDAEGTPLVTVVDGLLGCTLREIVMARKVN